MNNLFRRHLRWFRIIAVILALGVGAMVTDIFLRSRFQDTAAVFHFENLGISQPALSPAGTLHNRPETRHPGVDLRFSPRLPLHLKPVDLFSISSQPGTMEVRP